MIIIGRIVANREYYTKGLFGCVDSGFWSTQSNVIFVPSSSRINSQNIANPCRILTLTRTLNFIIPNFENGKITSIYKGDILSKSCTITSFTYDTSKLFSNKLNDMQGYTYTAIGNKADKLLLPEIQLMDTIATAQNARLNVSLREISRIKNFRLEIARAMVDMFLNIENFATLINSNIHLKKVNTFEVNGYCALVPIADDSMDFFQVTVHPFKREVWMYLFLSTLTAALIWNLYKKLSRHRTQIKGCITGDIISAFFQQSVNTRKGPFGLKVMIQAFVFMMMIIGYVYQGTITSALMDYRNHNKFSSVKELFYKEYELFVDVLFMQRINSSCTYRDNIHKIKSIGDGLTGASYNRKFQEAMTTKPKNVLIVRCDTVPDLLNTDIDHDVKARDVYYEFPEMKFTYYKSILLTRRTPFYEKLSELSLRIQESGIKQHWKMLRKSSKRSQKLESDEDSMLNLKAIKPVLHLHFHGLLIAGYTFLIEVLWTKYIKSYFRLVYQRWIKKCLSAVHKYRNRKVNPSCYNISIAIDPYHMEIFKFVKHVIKDWNQKHKNGINDISIINLDNDTSLYNIVREAIPKENPILLPDCKSLNNTSFSNTKESSIFVVISKVSSSLEHYVTGLHGCISSGFWTPLTNVLIIPPENITNANEIAYPRHVLINLRSLNFIIPFAKEGKIEELYSADTLNKKPLKIKSSYNTTEYFGDKLKDLERYTYTLTVGYTEKGSIHPEIDMLITIAKKQNAMLYAKFSNITNLKDFRQDIVKGKVDMFLNIGYHSGTLSSIHQLKTVYTYEINGYCALVPIVKIHEILLRFIVKPFSSQVWYLVFLYIAIGATVWQLSTSKCDRKLSGLLHFIIDLASVFLQQSIKIRNGRLVVKLMLQIFIFMMIVLGNVYQGVITSILMDIRKYNELTSMQELISTDFEFYGDQLLLQIMNESDSIWNTAKKTNTLKIWLQNLDYIKQFQKLMTVDPNNILIVGCDTVDQLLETQIDEWTKGYDVYYQFHQKILSYYEHILLTRRSPFYEKLGTLSLRIHESGIKQYWNMQAELNNGVPLDDENEASMLKLKEMIPIFQHDYANQLLGCVDSSFWTPQTNVLVIPFGNVVNMNEIVFPNELLKVSKTLNYIIPYVRDGKIFALYKGNILSHDKAPDTIDVSTDIDVLFDDKLLDMKGYPYTVLVNQNDNESAIVDDKHSMTAMKLLEVIAEKQNAKVQVNVSDIKSIEEIEYEITQGKIDIVLNLGYYSGLLYKEYFLKTVNTYETNGYCALVPIPYAHKKYFRFVLYPLSPAVWFMMVLSVTFGALVWHGFRKLSHENIVPGHYLIYDVFSVFIQQSINIRKGRTILRLMLQFLIFMMIILANLYQGMMTSILTSPGSSQKIKNIQELLTKDYELYGDNLFLQIMNVSDANRNIIERTKPLQTWLHSSNYIKQFQDVMTINPNNVLIVGCDLITKLLETQIDQWTKGYDVYYQFHQRLLSYYENILLTRRSPFYEKLCEMSLKIHESGIKQHWNLLMNKAGTEPLINASMLGIKELLSVFRVYYYAMSTACFIFLLELPKHYFLIIYKRVIKKCMRRVQKYRIRKVVPRQQRTVEN
ncbi:unnamed protein product [Chironomus riparius]|uniref:Ionotropic receptor n=1 Tax=Chironomus riparius TaxID=315576 RepID=A0A9N9RJK9_9DIPT|nr:unnamed protein product [Chironomus riparius]